MIRFPFFLIILLYSLLPASSEAQLKMGFCGSKTPPPPASAAMRGVPGYFGCNVINKLDRTLQISLHVCLNSFGAPDISQTDIDEALARINQDFAPSGLQFEYCFTEFMPNNRFDSLDVFDYHNEETQMLSIHYEPNTINLYLVDTIGLQGFADVSGYASFPGGLDFIVIEKSAYNADDDTPSHEFGHFFGLYHTFETDMGIEFADGSNCETTGDLVCDTEADPSPDGEADPDDQCNYNGPSPQDPNGDWYLPPTDNLMSYYPGECKCRFTPQQYNRMIEQYQTLRFNLW